MSELQLREASANDAEAIIVLLYAAFEEYIGVLDPPSSVHKQTAESIQAKMGQAHWVLAEQDSAPVGCVMYENRGDYVYLGRLGVTPELRGRGIASALMRYVEARAQEIGVPAVQLSVRLTLSENRAMYERRGYRFLSYETHPGYPGPTYVTLGKNIENEIAPG